MTTRSRLDKQRRPEFRALCLVDPRGAHSVGSRRAVLRTGALGWRACAVHERAAVAGCNILCLAMAVIISMLRGVNLGPNRRVKMEALRDLYASLRLRDAQTYVQSGNVIFRSDEHDLLALTKRIEQGIEKRFGFSSDVVLRTIPELRDAIARNPFARWRGIEPNRLTVTFLASDPGEEARKQLRQLKTEPDELRIDGRELYIYYRTSMARPKVSWAAMEKILKTSGTARNWNSVTAMLEMAEKLDAAR